MKKFYIGIIAAVMTSVFFICFFIGRAVALRENDETNDIPEKTGITALPSQKKEEEKSVEADNKAENVPELTKKEIKKESEKTAEEEKLPDRMIFPCGKTVLKNYSQTAVYSKTMGDWRAHTGIDYKAYDGADVAASWDGTVSNVYKDRLWGNCVEIYHTKNLKSIYKNLADEIFVEKGQAVKKGQVIGKIGKSAAVESLEEPHLHFEIWQDGIVINPISYVY